MHLTDCFMELFAYIGHFLNTVAVKQPQCEEVKQTVVRLLEKSNSQAVQGDFSRDDFDLARFAVCAWTDEVLVRSPWDQKHLWLKEQLQRGYFNTTAAGEEFFEKLEGLGLHQREVREVYYLCLALGFTGRFCKPGDELQLEQLKVGNLKLLLGSSVGLPALDRGEIFPEAYPSADTSGLSPRKLRRPVSLVTAACLGGPVLALCFLFIIYRFILSNVGDNFLKALGN